MNPGENDPSDNPRLQALVKELTRQISLLFSESDQIRALLVRLEEEGYQVDSLIASLSPASPDSEGEEIEGTIDADFCDLNPFDHAFLRTIKVRP